ncbi:MAG: hypothetical protein D6754_13645, partial [Alphaproteobacteria bacterium]
MMSSGRVFAAIAVIVAIGLILWGNLGRDIGTTGRQETPASTESRDMAARTGALSSEEGATQATAANPDASATGPTATETESAATETAEIPASPDAAADLPRPDARTTPPPRPGEPALAAEPAPATPAPVANDVAVIAAKELPPHGERPTFRRIDKAAGPAGVTPPTDAATPTPGETAEPRRLDVPAPPPGAEPETAPAIATSDRNATAGQDEEAATLAARTEPPSAPGKGELAEEAAPAAPAPASHDVAVIPAGEIPRRAERPELRRMDRTAELARVTPESESAAPVPDEVERPRRMRNPATPRRAAPEEAPAVDADPFALKPVEKRPPDGGRNVAADEKPNLPEGRVAAIAPAGDEEPGDAARLPTPLQTPETAPPSADRAPAGNTPPEAPRPAPASLPPAPDARTLVATRERAEATVPPALPAPSESYALVASWSLGPLPGT